VTTILVAISAAGADQQDQEAIQVILDSVDFTSALKRRGQGENPSGIGASSSIQKNYKSLTTLIPDFLIIRS
jgi:hypothetical protein